MNGPYTTLRSPRVESSYLGFPLQIGERTPDGRRLGEVRSLSSARRLVRYHRNSPSNDPGETRS